MAFLFFVPACSPMLARFGNAYTAAEAMALGGYERSPFARRLQEKLGLALAAFVAVSTELVHLGFVQKCRADIANRTFWKSFLPTVFRFSQVLISRLRLNSPRQIEPSLVKFPDTPFVSEASHRAEMQS